MKPRAIIIHKQLFGNRINFSKVLFFFLIPLYFSCSPMKHYRKHNYFNGGKFYNDTLNIKCVFAGDITWKDAKNSMNPKILNKYGLHKKSLLFWGSTYIEPYYDLFVFYKKIKQPKELDKPVINLLFKDTIKPSILYKKSYKDKNIYVYLKDRDQHESTVSLFADAKSFINSFDFNLSIKYDLTYTDIFNSYKDESNILFVMHKLNTAPIPYTERSEWTKFQYLATLLANDTSYPTYAEMIEKFEENRKEHLKPIISEVLNKNPNVETTLEGTIDTIKMLSANEKVLMLNEMHWNPKDRIFATKLLQPLKENGYHYLAVEALSLDFVADLNKRKFPTKNTGYYTREPFFGLFIRKAIEMGFKLVAYDEFGTENREKIQAENLNKIFIEDPNAKVFVYAGIDHILENNSKNKRMAEHFKELSGINPLTIDQVELMGNEKSEALFFPSGFVPKNKNINSDVDYFFINNIETSLNNFFNKDQLLKYNVKIDELEPYANQEVYLSVYILNEYNKYKSQAISIFNKIMKIKDKEITLLLPIGKYEFKIYDINNKLISSRQIEVIK